MLSLRKWYSCFCVIVIAAAFGCEHENSERQFFDNPSNDRLNRLRQYDLEEQYKIFRYGNDKIEPPLTELAAPIAGRGAEAIPFLLAKLNSASDDLTIRDIIQIFQTMASFGFYDVKSDQKLMNQLTFKVSQMNDRAWQKVCIGMLQQIKANPS